MADSVAERTAAMCTAKEMGEVLKKAETLVLVSHVSPDGDTLGSTLALARVLEKMGKKITLTVDDDIPDTFEFLPGIEKYRRFSDDEKIKADLLVVLDASSADRIGNVMQVVEADAIANIDHHKTNTEFADYLYLDWKAAATAELIYLLLQSLKAEIDEKTALCIFTALYTDTGSFKYSNTLPRTFRIAAAMVECGVDPGFVSDHIEVKKRDQLEMLGKVLETMQFLCEGKLAYIEIAPELYDKNVDTDTFIYYPRYIQGVEIAILFKQVEENVTRISFRSSGKDVSAIAFELGGGGHPKAAGCTVYADLKETEAKVLPMVQELLK